LQDADDLQERFGAQSHELEPDRLSPAGGVDDVLETRTDGTEWPAYSLILKSGSGAASEPGAMAAAGH
jgi:hypothetical protein